MISHTRASVEPARIPSAALRSPRFWAPVARREAATWIARWTSHAPAATA